jgi:hypothetical protein
MKYLVRIFPMFIAAFLALNSLNAQSTKQQKQEKVKNMVESNNYVFEANYAIPQSGGSRQLTDVYDLKISKDSVIADLPFFGEAFLAPNPSTTEGGIKFTSTNFTYQQKTGKKGSWQIFIKPKDGNISNWRDVQQMELSISANGYASLTVISSNRTSILFEGDIVAKD